jgi:hypothetical protein
VIDLFNRFQTSPLNIGCNILWQHEFTLLKESNNCLLHMLTVSVRFNPGMPRGNPKDQVVRMKGTGIQKVLRRSQNVSGWMGIRLNGDGKSWDVTPSCDPIHMKFV